jgi:CheY-like chemotaxis protein
MAPTILVVEDNPDMASTLAMVLEFEGYAVITALNGLEAQQRLLGDSTLPALILLDLQMPVMDGQTFLRTLPELAIPGATEVPVLVLTASTEQLAGVAGTLRKPYDIGELLSRVAGVVEPG